MAYTFRIHCRASDDHSLAIVNGDVVLTKADPRDDRQIWYKDVTYGSGLKDEAGSPAFALVNKATGDALKHSFGYSCPVRVIKFDPGYLDESVLWAESDDPADGFRRIHMINNADYIFDADHAIPCYGGARDGTRLILFRWNGGKNQLWRIAPHSAAPEHAPPVRIFCQSNQTLCLTVRNGTAVLAHADHKDEKQCWIQSFRNTGHVTDKEGHRSFALVNRVTGKALRHSRGNQSVCPFLIPSYSFALVNRVTGKALRHPRGNQSLQVVGHSPDSVEVALLWTLSDDLGEGFHVLRTVSNVGLVLDAANGVSETGGAHDGTPIIVFPWNGGPNQNWKMLPFY